MHLQKNKLLLFLFFFSFSPLLQAKPVNSFNNMYVGGSLGGSFADANQHLTGSAHALIAFGIFSTITPLDLKTNMAKNALAGSIYTGYGHTWDRVYLGGELNGNASNYNMSNSISYGLSQKISLFTPTPIIINGNAKINTQAKISPIQFAASVRPGYLLTPDSLLYGRVGVAIAKVTVSANTIASGGFIVVDTVNTSSIVPLNISSSKHAAILQLGGGLEQHFLEHWGLRVDYIYSYYGKMLANATNSAPLNLIDPDTGDVYPGSLVVNGQNKVTMFDQTILLGVIYHF